MLCLYIDPSRMYLPPRMNSVASSGFGGQTDLSNNVGGNNNGYGEVENVQGSFAKTPTANGNYGPSQKPTDGANDVQSTLGSYDTSTRTSNGPVGTPLDQSNSYNTLSQGENNFGQPLNKNNYYTGSINVPGTNNNYGSSLGTTSMPTNNNVGALTEDGYGQNELLNTAQNLGPTKYNYNGGTGASQIGQNPIFSGDQYSQQGTLENTAGGYGNTGLSTSKAPLQDNNRIGGQNAYGGQGGDGNVGPNGGQQFSVDKNGYTAPYSYGQQSTGGEYSQIANGNRPGGTQFNVEKSIDISNNPSSIGSVGFQSSVPNFNALDSPISKSPSQSNNGIINGNYKQNEFPNTRGFQTGGYNQEVSSSGYDGQYPSGSNQGASATTQSYGQNDFGKPNTGSYSPNLHPGESYSQTLPINNGFEQSPNNAFNQKYTAETNKNQIGSQVLNSGTNNGVQSGITSLNSFGQNSPGIQSLNQGQGSSNYENGFGSSPQSPNSFGQSGSHSIGNEDDYSNISPAYNGFNQGQQNQQQSNSYGPPQSFINERNPVQSQSNGPANGGYNQDSPSNSPNGFVQSRPTTSQVSNNISQTEYQPSSFSGNGYGESGTIPQSPQSNDGYYQGSSPNVLNSLGENSLRTPYRGRPNNYGPTESQTLSTTRNNYNQNSPSNGVYPQGAAQNLETYEENGVKSNSFNRGNLATTSQIGSYSQNGLSTQNAGQGSSSSLPGYGQRIGPCTSTNSGNVDQSQTSTADPGYGIRNQKKHSTLVPKRQFQNSNLPSSGTGVPDSSDTNKNDNNYGEPGFNSFSNFSPGNQPNQPIIPGTNNNCGASKYGDGVNEVVFQPSNTGY